MPEMSKFAYTDWPSNSLALLFTLGPTVLHSNTIFTEATSWQNWKSSLVQLVHKQYFSKQSAPVSRTTNSPVTEDNLARQNDEDIHTTHTQAYRATQTKIYWVYFVQKLKTIQNVYA